MNNVKNAENNNPRKPWLAFILSVLLPGLGQVYNGRPLKGALFWISLLALSILIWIGTGYFLDLGFSGLVLTVLVLLAARLFIAVEALLQARRLKSFESPKYDVAWVYIALLVGSYFFTKVALKPLFQALNTCAPVRTYYIPSMAMSPTLQPGDMLMADTRGGSEIERGSIIVFRNDPRTPDLIKRVIGLPGETVEIDNGKVLIDGNEVEEPFWDTPQGTFGPEKVPEDEYFVLGDNINNSRDSRWIGTISSSEVIGVVRYRFWGSEVGTDLKPKGSRSSK